MNLVELTPADFTVGFAREGVMLDLGAIGKGYAIDRAAEILREAGVTSGILHGGTSSVYAIGHPPDAAHWKVAIERPAETGKSGLSAADHNPPGTRPGLLAVVPLKDEALSVSAIWGKSFQSAGETFGHVIDPRTGQPAGASILAAVALASTTATDALSTALLVLGPEGIRLLARVQPQARMLVLARNKSGLHPESRGIPLV
jgi:FAD:protein FMN transferase